MMRPTLGNPKSQMPRAVVAALAVFAVVGCSSASPDDQDDTTPNPSSSGAPNGSVTVGCDDSRPSGSDSPPPGADDLIIGPLAYQGAILSYQGTDNPDPAPKPDADGVTYFKTGAELPPDTTVTVSIGKAARSYAGIVTEKGPSTGYPSVTYESCSEQDQASRVWWAGGFALRDRPSACVPIDVQVKREDDIRHVTVSLASDAC